MTAVAKYPEYERDAIFRCGHCGHRFRRDKCLSFRGSLCCPSCRLRWTLQYAGRAALAERERP